ncbi:ABC transporter permease [Shinella sp. 838]|jgi:NitT/TauT family transport system permease protein|uniref:ABC transporter permease n=2 Tax=Shinella TaxID=323620 RepID=UPI0003C53219|nr:MULTISPECIES: ABC transporter permease [unclassified Shinella]EYR84368.1 ABC-type nitrate/sulfonate/bicarbonate transport system permease component [Shinella sp. DD12]MCA0338499.1 ABC transporter permease [Pseudomonadota bacterium]MDG4673419.1 ABC transporter permease [Shinella sp. 838]
MSQTDMTMQASGGVGFSMKISRVVYPLLSLIVIIALWQLVVSVAKPAPYLLPSPGSVASTLISQFPVLIYHSGITAFETLIAFLFSIVVALPLAVLIARFRWFEDAVYPLLVTSQAVPKVALAPLILVWLGFGLHTNIVVGVLMAFFPVVISGVVGLKSVPQDMVFLGKTMGLSQAQMFRKIYLPHALPSLFGGLKVCVTLAVVGAVVGEFVGSDRGLGYLILLSSGQLQTALMFAALILLVLIGVVSFAIVQFVEARVMPWHRSQRRDGH